MLQLFPPVPVECRQCGVAHSELGVLCATCRSAQQLQPDAYLQGTIAGAILGLKRWESQGHPLSGPLAESYERMKIAYDAAEPRITVPRQSYVHAEHGNCWAYPAGTSFVLGPFATEELAHDALIEFEAERAKQP